MKHTVTGSEITGCGCADVAVGLFQYDAKTEVGNSPGAVYAESLASSAVTPFKLANARSAKDAGKVSMMVVLIVAPTGRRVPRCPLIANHAWII